jgi:hypothetical protein
MKVLGAALLLTITIAAVFAQPKVDASVRQIDAYVRMVDRMMQRRKAPDLIIADVSDYETDVPEWRAFKTEKDLERFRESTETYTIANNWRQRGRIVSSFFTLFSPSGDWAQYVTHYFRLDGTAAKVIIEMRTFNGDYIVTRSMYFDTRGKLLKKAAKYLDLTTKKPKKPTPEMLDENSGFFPGEYYKKVSSLPFYSLTRTKL